MSTPVLGCIADDFTGATDLASNLVEAGMRTLQWLGVPDPAEVPAGINAAGINAANFDAIVIALKTRSVPADDAIRQSLEAYRALSRWGVQRYYFKYCSTFDSTDRGNIGPVAEALIEAADALQTIFCPAFPENGRTVYHGHLFVHQKLLNESGMEKHPLNPMTDANLVRVLGRQVQRGVGLVPYEDVERGAEAVQQALRSLNDSGVSLVLVDALQDDHLRTIAEATADMRLVTGGSGLAIGLPAAYRARGILASHPAPPRRPEVGGGTAILAGSCSSATQQQVSWMKSRCPAWSLDVRRCVTQRNETVRELWQWASAQDLAKPILVYSTMDAEQVAELQAVLGREVAAQAVESVFACIAARLVAERGIRRLIVAGGETSGAVVSRLGVRALRIGPRIAPGVPWTETLSDPPLALALKSGNFGGPDFFQAAVEMLP